MTDVEEWLVECDVSEVTANEDLSDDQSIAIVQNEGEEEEIVSVEEETTGVNVVSHSADKDAFDVELELHRATSKCNSKRCIVGEKCRDTSALSDRFKSDIRPFGRSNNGSVPSRSDVRATLVENKLIDWRLTAPCHSYCLNPVSKHAAAFWQVDITVGIDLTVG
ncbi:hypothetical protein J6590_015970 [Homalodisca vitripennis]|nr:hypothetical protein J6590_015970 [Homalodisca vitripennis]